MKKHDLLAFDVEEFQAGKSAEIKAARDVGREVNYGNWDMFFDDVYDELPPNVAA